MKMEEEKEEIFLRIIMKMTYLKKKKWIMGKRRKKTMKKMRENHYILRKLEKT